MDEEIKSALNIVDVSIQSFIDKLKEAKPSGEANVSSVQFEQSEFFRQMDALTDTLSHECTKFSMIFTDEATPSARSCKTICDRLIGVSAALFKTVTDLPGGDKIGSYFRRSICKAAMEVLNSIRLLAVAARECPNNVKAQLKETGTCWEACERLKAVPKGSRDLLLRDATEALNLINDAFAEIQELISDSEKCFHDDVDEPSQSDRRKVRLNACTQLIKAAKATLSKTRSAVEQSTIGSSAAADDEITSAVEQLSPSVDDLVSTFYDDTDSDSQLKEVSKLRDVILMLLEVFKKTTYYQEGAHSKWMDILCTAAHHNFTKYCSASESASK